MPEKVIRVLQVGMSTNYGGTEAVVYEIYRHIDRTKIQFDFLNVYDEPLAKQEWLESLGARIYSLKLKRREGYFKYLRGIKAFYREHAKEIDTVVCNVQCLDQIAMAKYAKKFGIRKTLIHLHNANYGIQPSKLARIVIAWNKRNCHKYVDQLLACSSLAAKWGYSKKDAQRCYVLKQGINIERMRFSDAKRRLFRDRIGCSDDVFLFGSVGRMDPQKNQFYLLEVFRTVLKKRPDAKLVLVGEGPLEKPIQDAIAKSGVTHQIVLISRIEDIEVFYSGIDCFVLPSKFEGLGMVLIEAQCAGLPCFATLGTIPSEVKLTPKFTFLPINQGIGPWVRSLACVQREVNRATAYLAVAEAGRDTAITSNEYSSLLNVAGH